MLVSAYDILFVQLCMHEGVRLYKYNDSRGNATIGVGHKMTDEDISTYGNNINIAECTKLLRQDLDVANTVCRKYWPDFDTFPLSVRVALCDMAFNLGSGGLRTFVHFIRCIALRAWNSAAQQLHNSEWYKQAPGRVSFIMQQLTSRWDE